MEQTKNVLIDERKKEIQLQFKDNEDSISEIILFFKDEIQNNTVTVYKVLNDVVDNPIYIQRVEMKNEKKLILPLNPSISPTHIIFKFNQFLGMNSVDRIEVKKETISVESSRLPDSDEKLLKNKACISLMKKVHSNQANEFSYLVTNGLKTSFWVGDYYPCYLDINLETAYLINEIQVQIRKNQKVSFCLYTSVDGENFKRVFQQATPVFTKDGEISIKLDMPVSAKIVRFQLLYNSVSPRPTLQQISVFGKELEIQPAVARKEENLLSHLTPVKPLVSNDEETINGVQGIIKRRLGEKYLSWFSFVLKRANNKKDYFELKSNGNNIQITGNNGVSLATGLNYYLKHFCHVLLTQKGMGDQTIMPENLPEIFGIIFKESSVPLRYAYNYCTHSYTMAFWNEEDWQQELDWLALNGVNCILDPTGVEGIWYQWMHELGYPKEEIYDYLTLPTHSAWQWMGNMSRFSGPLNRDFIMERVELARKNHRKMLTLGMQPILQGYNGKVPTNFEKYFPQAKLIPQGKWCQFQQPDLVNIDTSFYQELATRFYTIQKELFGDITPYFSTDLFHEGGNKGDIQMSQAIDSFMSPFLKAYPDGKWVIQSWQQNPIPEMTENLSRYSKHVLILDLYAEKEPHWDMKDEEKYGGKEFHENPWIFCMLNNFGGRMGLSGHLDSLFKNYTKAVLESKQMKGIGFTGEATQSNPLLFDFLLELPWLSSSDLKNLSIEKKVEEYVFYRYGVKNEKLVETLSQLVKLVYSAKNNEIGQGAPESILNARPIFPIRSASTWGNAIISYDMKKFEKLFYDYFSFWSELKDHDGYCVDGILLFQQVISNRGYLIYQEMEKATSKEERIILGKKLLQLCDFADDVANQLPLFSLDCWLKKAREFSKITDEFLQDQFVLYGKTLLTTWGSYPHANLGGLKDYSNRQWAQLTSSLYKKRWEMWLEKLEKEEELTEDELFEEEWFFNLSYVAKDKKEIKNMTEIIDTFNKFHEGE